MSFFKDFKEDLSQAVNELVPGEDGMTESMDDVVNTLDVDNLDLQKELDKLGNILEDDTSDKTSSDSLFTVASDHKDDSAKEKKKTDEKKDTKKEGSSVDEKNNTAEEKDTQKDVSELSKLFQNAQPITPKKETVQKPASNAANEEAVITAGMKITGDVESAGSITVEGTITGNVKANGKLVVTGVINGNTESSEFFADSAKMNGEVNSTGTVKVGAGSIIKGNISATSAVIAGAVKGDIDVHGPVIVDTSAVVAGNIKSKSVQINNGAVIEGFCSQCYSDVDMDSLFGQTFGE